MLKAGHHPTPEELDAIMARARGMRAQCVGALLARAWLRVTRPVLGGGARDALAALYSGAR